MNDISILVVDDEVDFLETIVNRLHDRGFVVHGLSNGGAALDYLQENKVDVVVLDVKMPRMDGLTVLKEIKSNLPEVEVIMLTGHASVESGVQGMQIGAFDYLMKPARLEDLIKKIQLAHERKILRENKLRQGAGKT